MTSRKRKKKWRKKSCSQSKAALHHFVGKVGKVAHKPGAGGDGKAGREKE